MNYTTQKNQTMNDFDLGKALALKLGKTIASEQYFHYQDRDENVVLLFPQGDSFNVNNWNDIMPIAIDYGVCADAKRKMAWTEDPCASGDVLFKYVTESTTPQRAIAYCLLMLMESNPLPQ